MKKLLLLVFAVAAVAYFFHRPDGGDISKTEVMTGPIGDATIIVQGENGEPVDLASLPPEVREAILKEIRAHGGPGVSLPPESVGEKQPAKSFTYRDASATHTRVFVSGWSILVERELSDNNTPFANRVLAQLERDLDRLVAMLPEAAVNALRMVPIWVSQDTGRPGAAEYYWTNTGGAEAAKAGAVVLSRALDYLEMVQFEAPWMLLHELSHAYHERVLGSNYAPIRNAFEAARAAGLYDSVKHIGGSTDRAYALSNEREYFAELTEAYFGRNDYFPFNREELRKYDPVGYLMVERAWTRP